MVQTVIRGERFWSTDPALLARGPYKVSNDVRTNRATGVGELLGPQAVLYEGIVDKLRRKLVVVCAAGSLTAGEEGLRRIDRLNAEAANSFVIAAGAGHYALPHLTRLDAAITNFSVGNSHTKAFANPEPNILYLVASHCASEEIDGVKGTLQCLLDAQGGVHSNIRLFHADLPSDIKGFKHEYVRVGTGTGAPPAAIAVISALRQQCGIDEPMDVELYGFDGTTSFLPGVKDELPAGYLQRLKDGNVTVVLDGKAYDVQEVFLDQMEQIAAMVTDYPHLVRSVRVDGAANTLTAAIFNTPDGVPNLNYMVHRKPAVDPSVPELGM